MKIEFDSTKDKANRAKHGLSLAEGAAVFDDPAHLIISSIRNEDKEDRFKVIGRYKDRMHTAIYVWRDETIRFISVRRSNKNEENHYSRRPG